MTTFTPFPPLAQLAADLAAGLNPAALKSGSFADAPTRRVSQPCKSPAPVGR